MDRETFLTDPGPCEWAKVFVPDKKYDDFGIDMILSPALAEAHQKRVRAEVQAWPNFNNILAEAKLDPKPHPRGGPVKGLALPPWETEEDGNFRLKFRSDAQGGPKGGPMFDITIDVFDSKMNPWPREVAIGNGSVVSVCYYLYPWNNPTPGGIGCSLRLVAVQVIDHVPYEAETHTHGFTAREGVDIIGHGFAPVTAPAPDRADLDHPHADHTGGPVVDDIPF